MCVFGHHIRRVWIALEVSVMLFDFHYSHHCALNHCFNYLINIMSFQSQLKETEAEDNILFVISKQFEIYFSYYSEISINEPRYNEVLGITNDFLYSSDRTLI